ncbi:MAG: DEAD/DEAH box helicase [Propionibacterium sp.]|nr:DEAD/DEAH box helicase [Propionibacterium sp.]
MGELLPGPQAQRLREGILDYLTTTFALAEPAARSALRAFLADEDSGMFKGPYLKTGMPFRADPRRAALGWLPPGFRPYAHQAEAFTRLSSRDGRPQPTLVTTGTGSGKTEAFLYPIIDHCLRARRYGVPGVKALILYPMNALASDQAARLAKLLCPADAPDSRALGGITAAIYTGEQEESRPRVTPEGLITDRSVIRDDPPDILLTNYKMLDQLLLRAEDQALWRNSADSLTYLVLDEFHTYDGAQGTDVAMLLRRLGLALKSHWPARGSSRDNHSPAEWERPLGKITPVGTSATLGPSGDAADPTASIIDFATQVFGERFDAGSVVKEQRMSAEDWQSQSGTGEKTPARTPLKITPDMAAKLLRDLDGTPERERAAVLLRGMFEFPAGDVTGVSREDMQHLVRSHPFIQDFLEETRQATHLTELTETLLPGEPATLKDRRAFLVELHAALGQLRAAGPDGRPDRGMPTTEVHLWIREVTRLDRYAEVAARFRWYDDGPAAPADETQDSGIAFPAIYCRMCGRSGWGVSLAPVGSSLAASDEGIRRDHAAREGRFRALLHAPAETQEMPPGVVWFDPGNRELTSRDPDDQALREGRVLRVQTHTGPDADQLSRKDTCPGCQQSDAIRFMGSAVATLLSVCLSSLFTEGAISSREKKALVFTDSVQDAAHRAGFVTARSHTLTLRCVLAEATDQPRTLPELVERVIEIAGTDPVRRYRLLPPDLAHRDDLRSFWQPDATRRTPSPITRRLLFDAALEFGLVSGYGRTLERTGTSSAHIEAGTPEELAALAGDVVKNLDQALFEADITPAQLVAWVRGVLERMRTRGAIAHPWLRRYVKRDGNRWDIWGGRPTGMPAFPKGRTAPAFPRAVGSRIDPDRTLLDPVASPQSWYATWTRRCLGITTGAPVLARALLDELTAHEILQASATDSGGRVYALPGERVVVTRIDDTDLAEGRHSLRCTACHSMFPVSRDTGDQLAGAPCLHQSCTGTLTREPGDPGNFYRHLYRSGDARQIVAREHTSLLDAQQRLDYENGFKRSGDDPSAPNVLVATPTLEMGIDIGDLSAVFLASLPRRVANYVQRVGRAGRLTGNALDIAFARGRGEVLSQLGDPLSLINGAVTPPATYLSAEEILRRQYLAHLADRLARDPKAIHPRTTAKALELPGPGTFLGQLIELARTDAEDTLAGFLASFDVGETSALRTETIEAMRSWAIPGDDGFALAETIIKAARAWHEQRTELMELRDAIQQQLPDLRSREADSKEDAQALREAEAELRLIGRQLSEARHEYWVAALERQGLLPNYSLIDDSVQLDVTMTWSDSETEERHLEEGSYTRPSARALTDFAPGATFYVGGHQISIDAVDIGPQGNSIGTLRLCPHCGYAQELARHATGAQQHIRCPRCEQPGIGDRGQCFRSVELTKVSAYVRREESRIDDRADERQLAGFTVLGIADIDPDRVQRRWFTSTGIEFAYLRQLDLRWLNLGPRRHTAAELMIAGERIKAPLFRICSSCGHLDRGGLVNSRDEHRPWCKHRNDPDEHIENVLLHRRLTTEAILLGLPKEVAYGHDPFALPSLIAAIQLGLRESYGGAPDHLAALQVRDPRTRREALLLHDLVPGGTGYLAELADPEQLRTVLQRAHDRLTGCGCAGEGRLACHRCLLPFAASNHRDLTSRSVAAQHLATMLGSSWEINEEPRPAEDPESWLEQRFRRAFVRLAEKLGATVTQQPGLSGNTISVSLGNRRFKLQPQVTVQDTRPDFLLSSPGLHDVAIYTDGLAFHASPEIDRIADDAAKRSGLRDLGMVVLAVTAADLDADDDGIQPPAPAWYRPELAQRLNAKPQLQHNDIARKALTGGPIAFLEAWLQGIDVANLSRFGHTVPVQLFAAGRPPSDPLGHQAVAALPGDDVRVWRHGTLAVAVAKGPPGEMPLHAVLDDTADLGTPEAQDSWREWLRLANAVVLLPVHQALLSAATMAAKTAGRPAERTSVPVDLVPGWVPVAAEFGGEEMAQVLIGQLSAAGVEPPDGEVGQELGDGIPFDLVWEQDRIAVQLDPSAETVSLPGWRVLAPKADLIVAAWKEQRNG